jgi:hypothetical protein
LSSLPGLRQLPLDDYDPPVRRVRGRNFDGLSVRLEPRDPRGDQCVGCGRIYERSHSETICRKCVNDILTDPDEWLRVFTARQPL